MIVELYLGPLMNERINQLKQLIPGDKDPFLPYALALEYKKAGEAALAASTLEELLDQHPDYLPSYYQLGKIYEEEGEEEKALVTYKSGAELAQKERNMKTLGELNEAIWFLED